LKGRARGHGKKKKGTGKGGLRNQKPLLKGLSFRKIEICSPATKRKKGKGDNIGLKNGLLGLLGGAN